RQHARRQRLLEILVGVLERLDLLGSRALRRRQVAGLLRRLRLSGSRRLRGTRGRRGLRLGLLPLPDLLDLLLKLLDLLLPLQRLERTLGVVNAFLGLPDRLPRLRHTTGGLLTRLPGVLVRLRKRLLLVEHPLAGLLEPLLGGDNGVLALNPLGLLLLQLLLLDLQLLDPQFDPLVGDLGPLDRLRVALLAGLGQLRLGLPQVQRRFTLIQGVPAQTPRQVGEGLDRLLTGPVEVLLGAERRLLRRRQRTLGIRHPLRRRRL